MGRTKAVIEGVAIGLLVNLFWAGVLFVAQYFGIDLFLNLLNTQLPLTLTIVAVIVTITIVIMVLRSRDSNVHVSVIRRRPMHSISYTMECFGVKWHVLYGGGLFGEDSYAFVDGDPRCPTCDYEMSHELKGLILKKYYWKCDSCGKLYLCSAKDPYEAKKIVEKLLESDIRNGRVQNE